MPFKGGDLVKYFKTTKSFEHILNKLNIKSIGNGKCVAELKVEEEHTNIMGGLHGGFSATLVDSVSSYALATHHQVNAPHVSVHINTEYVKGAKINDEIEIEANTVKVGKSLAFLEVFIREKQSGALLVKGSHTKFLLAPKE
ncbi:hypothetical protein ABEB36_006733 [Hypothenemus hampei]|uniref:Thioesterase domain-containing protein n=1 Tax=Hypothenemus hampei TaxID=57062 RepID=A0ABD1ERK1_HYPHA